MADLIDRQALITEMCDGCDGEGCNRTTYDCYSRRVIEEAPTVEHPKECDDCKHQNEVPQRVNLRCRDCLADEHEYHPLFEAHDGPKSAYWIDANPSDPLDPRVKCAACNRISTPKNDWNFCPYCGAKNDYKLCLK